MCECTQISYEKCDKCVNIHMKNVNDIDFDVNMLIDMCMKVMFVFVYIKLCIIDKHIYLYHAYYLCV